MPNITKDEARILAAILADGKYILANEYRHLNLMYRLNNLENKLSAQSKDKRRTGRKSMNDFTDCLKRFRNK